MMLFLAGDVAPNLFNLRTTNRERPVPALPNEVPQRGRPFLEPKRGATLEFLDPLRCLAWAREIRQQMHVVLDATDHDGLTREALENSSEIVMQFVSQGRILQKGPALFGGEHCVHEDFGQRLRHWQESEPN